MVVIFCSVFSLKLFWNAGEIGNVSVFRVNNGYLRKVARLWRQIRWGSLKRRDWCYILQSEGLISPLAGGEDKYSVCGVSI